LKKSIKDLNVISFNIPYPPDYGGVIDIFYRLKALSENEINVHLHCFGYGRQQSKELEKICKSVKYYRRKSDIFSILSAKPYIVASRRSEMLLQNLLKNDYPILFEGIHSTYYLKHPALRDRKKFVRAHNIEDRYYRSLAKNEKNIFRRTYFLIESCKLKIYEKVLSDAQMILAITENENSYFQKNFKKSYYLPPFHPFNTPHILPGLGEYVLFHGDLSVNGNQKNAEFLISSIFPKLKFKCIIAGKNPSKMLVSAARKIENLELVSNPDIQEMDYLIRNAQINILLVIGSDGFKIKMLYALFSGRHCITNYSIYYNPELKNLCTIADTEEELLCKINDLLTIKISDEIIESRKKVLDAEFSNQINCKNLIKKIYNI
jgi:hypothetical protein